MVWDDRQKKMIEVPTRREIQDSMGVVVHSDNLGEMLWHPGYNRSDPNSWTDSKSKFRHMTRAKGYYEVGTEEVKASHRGHYNSCNIDWRDVKERVSSKFKR